MSSIALSSVAGTPSVGHTSTVSAYFNANTSWNHTVSTENLLIVAFSSSGFEVTSATFGAQSMTRAIRHALSFTNCEIWYLVSPTAGTSSISLNVTGSGSAGAGAVSFNNAEITSRIIDSFGYDGSVQAAGVTATCRPASQNAFVVSAAERTFGANLTTPGGQTEFMNVAGLNAQFAASYSGPLSPGNATHTYSSTAGIWTCACVGIGSLITSTGTVQGVGSVTF